MPGPGRVELTFRHGVLSGSAGGQPVSLELSVPAHRGRAAGMITGIPVSAAWTTADNYRVYPDVPADLAGAYGGQPVEMHATFHLGPGWFFSRGTITGQIGTEAFSATVEAAETPAGLGGKAVTVAGTLGSTEFTISAATDGPLTRGEIRGNVAGAPLHIHVARSRGTDGGHTRLSGNYQGPPALLALAAGAFLHFI